MIFLTVLSAFYLVTCVLSNDIDTKMDIHKQYRYMLSQCPDQNPLNVTSPKWDNGYHKWLASIKPGTYTNHLYLPSAGNVCDGLAFHWRIDAQSSKIHIAVAAKATGWVAVGFSETGGMKGADIVYYEASKGQLIDAHVGNSYSRPMRDKIQDWTLQNGAHVTDDGFIIFEAERALFTNRGHEDREIIDDSNIYVADHKIIGAWGDSSSLGFHGKNVVKGSAQLFSSAEIQAGDGMTNFHKEMDERSDGSVTLKLDNYMIPQDETTYYTKCFTVDDLVTAGLYEDSTSSTHIIGMEFIIDPETIKYAHHMLLQGQYGDSCGKFMPTIGGWTPGEDYVIFPEGTGLKVGGSSLGSFRALALQYHFDNIDGDVNKVDTGSGVKIFYTRKPISNEIGMFVVGDGIVSLAGEKIGEGKTLHEFDCPSTCFNRHLRDVDEITVVSEAHHMHAKGERIVSDLIRGDEIVNKASIDYWDFDQIGTVLAQQEPYKLKKGDSYKISCYYESYKNTQFGLGSSDEMCMIFIYYYPKLVGLLSCGVGSDVFDPTCGGTHTSSTLVSDSNFGRAMTDTTGSTDIMKPVVPSATPSPKATTSSVQKTFSGKRDMARHLVSVLLLILM